MGIFACAAANRGVLFWHAHALRAGRRTGRATAKSCMIRPLLNARLALAQFRGKESCQEVCDFVITVIRYRNWPAQGYFGIIELSPLFSPENRFKPGFCNRAFFCFTFVATPF